MCESKPENGVGSHAHKRIFKGGIMYIRKTHIVYF